MNETIKRRLSERNRKQWGVPDLVVIDGGKGQLDAAIQARDEQDMSTVPFIGLAKREEQIVTHKTKSNLTLNKLSLNKLGGFSSESTDFILINLPHNTNLVKLLQRIRDESHRFAVSYHSTLKIKRQTASLLDDVPGIGPATRKKLLRTFGSMRGIAQAPQTELEVVVGQRRAQTLKQHLAS